MVLLVHSLILHYCKIPNMGEKHEKKNPFDGLGFYIRLFPDFRL